ncbi:MAG: efflux RND transporter periplasmic adaptor subunit [Holosporaceae bacterium]|jgi:membrane fusion protein (multidrug efflux system)|nr:efflux RND transporter periplasmic adaptor subunit [Holosporaceae bacterium]
MRKNLVKRMIYLILLTISGCKDKEQMQVPIPVVGATKALRQDVPIVIEAPAKISGSLEIQIRAQVGGILKSRVFQEGQYVREGEKLFEIDPEPYKAALTRAQGALAQAESELRRTTRDYERMQKLFKDGAISQKEHDDALSAYERASANLKVAEGSLHEAEINLGYTVVKAPISGMVRKEAQSIGNLISPTGESSLLTSMVQICPLHVNFSISGAMWSSLNKGYRDGKIKLSKSGDFKVEVILPDGIVYPQIGKIIFVDSSEDNLTSSISIKAEIPNDKNQMLLLPGQFVRVRLIGAAYKDVIVIPLSALLSAQAGSFVYIVGADKLVEVRPVIAESVGEKAVIISGLKEGDVVVTEGVIKARPGQPVNIVLKPEDSPQQQKE